jgi:hypothetical protein
MERKLVGNIWCRSATPWKRGHFLHNLPLGFVWSVRHLISHFQGSLPNVNHLMKRCEECICLGGGVYDSKSTFGS